MNNNSTRREFLERTCRTAVGAAIGAPAVIRASALGREGPAPGERINVACIGVGGAWRCG